MYAKSGDFSSIYAKSLVCTLNLDFSIYAYRVWSICDRIWKSPPYGIRARFAQCAFLAAHIENNCQSPEFVIYVSNNPSSNLPSSTEASRAIRRRNKS